MTNSLHNDLTYLKEYLQCKAGTPSTYEFRILVDIVITEGSDCPLHNNSVNFNLYCTDAFKSLHDEIHEEE